MTTSIKIACALLVLAPMVQADTTKKMAKKQAITINANDMQWGTAPPDLPKGSQLAVLRGDPTKAGPFSIRLKAPDGYKIAPHWHSRDEELTIISGTLVLHMGDSMTAEPHELTQGAYHFLPGKMHHAAETKGETIVQVSGMGPFDIHYLNPADNPNPKTATR
jgi:mannose-6-phosphate isomerase-like protein (cupin superfamily)